MDNIHRAVYLTEITTNLDYCQILVKRAKTLKNISARLKLSRVTCNKVSSMLIQENLIEGFQELDPTCFTVSLALAW